MSFQPVKNEEGFLSIKALITDLVLMGKINRMRM
jgi:hypothetical protein